MTSPPQDSALPMARPTVPKKPKQKHGYGNKKANKRGRNQSSGIFVEIIY